MEATNITQLSFLAEHKKIENSQSFVTNTRISHLIGVHQLKI